MTGKDISGERGAFGRRAVMSVLLVAAGLLPGAARAFVPACTEEVAQNYPPILRADLSACAVAAEPKPEPNIDVKAFSTNLEGTWVLQSRTVQGITVEGETRYHIAIDQVGAAGAVGSAVLLECADSACVRQRVGGAWSVGLAPVGDRVTFTTRGQATPLGKGAQAAGPAARDSNSMRFFLQRGTYVAIDDASSPKQAAERKWDRIVVTDRTLTYISCAEGRVDRYVKTSRSSLVDGTPVRDLLERDLVGRLLKR